MSYRRATYGWVFPIAIALGRRLRIIIYARYSTEDQNPRSIDDQVAECRRFLESLEIDLSQCEIQVLSDRAISGEEVSRPGIDDVRAAIRDGNVDLIVTEETSRLYRRQRPCLDLVDGAVDNGVRVICINDQVDTADEEMWEERLASSVGDAARTNRRTRQRINRSLISRFEMGAALGPVRPGYLRRATTPATEREPARGPFFDEVDPEWAPTIEEAFEMVASGKPPWIVAQWLNERGLPKTSNWQRPEWTEPNVVALIRNRIYVGLGVFRTTVAQQIRSTGKTRQVPNDPEEILVNELPHLRIVSDSLRRQAIEAIDSRARSSVSGSEHVLYGIPRDSRGPLSRIIVCDICGHPLHATGRNEGGYRCRGANNRDCWNRTTALRQLTHERIAEAICQALLEFLPEAETLLAAARVQLEDTDRLDARLAELTTQHEEATAKYEQYGEAVGEGGDIVILVERLRHFEELRAGIDAEIERLRAERDVVVVPSYDELRQSILDRSRRIELMDRDARADLVDIVEEIRAVPFQQFGGNKVVLRAAIHLNLTGLLPWTVRSYIESLNEGSECVSVTTEFQKLIWVDLFNASNSPRYAMKVRALREAGRKFADIAGSLGLAEMAAKRADAFGKEMRAAGLTDPFVRLTEPPANASRWRDTRQARNNSTANEETDAA
ncbi:MAG: recombinase family protein [Planctomycetales bacterium]